MTQTQFTSAKQSSRASQAVFFSYGFRPFFLGASLYAAFAMLLWLSWIAIHALNASLTWMTISGAPYVWHAHEMVFGFALAALTGFLLTAIPNWTGAKPLAGQPLMILFATWVAGRAAMMLSAFIPSLVVAAIDLAFIPLLGVHVARQLFVRPQPRNMIFLALLTALFVANATYHLAATDLTNVDPTSALRAGVLIVTIVIVIIGGRIVPAFTQNYLQRAVPTAPPPIRSQRLDLIALITMVIFACLAVFSSHDWLIAIAAGAAALSNGLRLAGWRGLATLSSPIVVVLHVGYLWIVIGLTVWCIADATDLISEVSALHALSTGAVGTMVLAVMSRASLGHTGRPLVAPAP
ncbi:MAG TPA: NnrS family protein, partial [Hyphomicrobiaceae bacterium]|nr:NnrS family protein [Hyphomicrobiaceae bacterium]